MKAWMKRNSERKQLEKLKMNLIVKMTKMKNPVITAKAMDQK